MARARSRPPKLEARVGVARPAEPPTTEQLLDRAKVTGRSGMPGRSELRVLVERVAGGDRVALGEVLPIEGVTVVDVWSALAAVYGATFKDPLIDATRAVAAARAAGARIAAVAAAGGRIAFATSSPASLLPLHLALARKVSALGGIVLEQPDAGPIRVDGRSSRWLRWFDGVTVVTDGSALCAVHDGEAARELQFVLARPSLFVGDGAFAEAAWEAGIEVVALAGLDRCGLAVPAHRGLRATLVPVRTDRSPAAYRPLLAAFEAGFEAGDGGFPTGATPAL
jgi:hypothetical protein